MQEKFIFVQQKSTIKKHTSMEINEIIQFFKLSLHWGECEVVRLFLNNRLFNQELPFEMGDYHGPRCKVTLSRL
jgi:hypothetical protein